MNQTWESFLDEAMEYLQSQQDRLNADYQLSSWQRYNYNQEGGTIVFSSDGRIGIVADIHIVGSTSKSGGTWLWAWDNPSVLDRVKHCLTDVRTFGEVHGFDKLTTPKWPGDERDGWEMTAVAAFILQTQGAYRAPHDNGVLFMVLRNIRRPT